MRKLGSRGVGIRFQESHRGHHEAGHAERALEALLVDHALLDGGQFAGCRIREAFDRRDFLSARAVREHVAALNESIVSAKVGRASVQVGELQDSVVADLTTARNRASEQLADLLAALEATRLDLLRLRAGQGTPDQITHTMMAAKELGDNVERLLSARAEIEAALRTVPRMLGAEPTPA